MQKIIFILSLTFAFPTHAMELTSDVAHDVHKSSLDKYYRDPSSLHVEAIERSIGHQDLEELEILLKATNIKDIINSPVKKSGLAPIHSAARLEPSRARLRILQLLLNAGAHPDLPDQYGNTCYDYVKKNSDTFAFIQLLIAAGGKVPTDSYAKDFQDAIRNGSKFFNNIKLAIKEKNIADLQCYDRMGFATKLLEEFLH